MSTRWHTSSGSVSRVHLEGLRSGEPNTWVMDKIGSIFDLSAEEKLQLVEDLWDDLGADPDTIPVHEWQKAELDARKQRLAAAPTSTLGWDEVKAQVRSRRAL